MKNEFLTTTELAHKVGVSRITIFNWIKAGKLPAERVGKAYLIRRKDAGPFLQGGLTPQKKDEIARAVHKTVRDYGKVLERLGRE